jgi:hypothetical protein
VPIPSGDGGDYGRLVEELARRLAEQVRAGQTPTLDFGSGEAAKGMRPEDVYARMDELIREQQRLTRTQEQDERRLQSLRERAESARTPEGQARLREESGLRGQLGAARGRAAEPMGPPRALFREVEREERDAASARRQAARIAEQVEGRAARQRAREEVQERKAAGPMGPPRELFRQVEREEREAAQARREAARIAGQTERQVAREDDRAKEWLARDRRRSEREASAAVERFDREQARLPTAARSFALVAGGAAAAVYTARRFAGAVERSAAAANPEAGATFEGSAQALRQAVGETGPVQAWSRGASMLLQGAARVMRGQQGLFDMLAEGPASQGGKRPGPAFLQNLGIPGVSAESFQGGEDYYFSLQRAVSEAGANTLDAKNLADQLREMREQNNLLGDLKDNTKVLRRGIAAWRQ